MENNHFKVDHQGPSGGHFKARDLYKKKLANNQNEKVITENKEKKTPFSWIIETVNPLNHLPIVSSIKNIITKSNKSLDIVQSAVGGFLFAGAGPLGVLKGLGGWAVNRITNKFIAANSDETKKNIELESNLKKPNKNFTDKEIIDDQLSFNTKEKSNNKNDKVIVNKSLFTNSNINNYEIFNKKNSFNKAINKYSETKNHKNKINISA